MEGQHGLKAMDTTPDALPNGLPEWVGDAQDLDVETRFPEPCMTMVINEQRDDRVKFNWENEREMTSAYRPPYASIMAFSSDNEFRARLSGDILPSYPILPMIMHCSPVIAMTKYQKERPWVERWCTSQTTLWSLVTTRLFIQLVYGETQIKHDNKDLARAFDVVTECYRKKFQALNDLLSIQLSQNVYGPMRQKGILSDQHAEARNAMHAFAQCLCEFTYRLVHLNESIIYQYMCVASPEDSPFQQRDLSSLLTPRHPVQWNANNRRTTQDAAKDIKDMESWFQSKQSWAIVKGLSNVGGVYDPVRHIDHTQVVPQWQSGPNYADFIPYRLLWDYAMLLDGDKILGDASRGTPIDSDEIKELRSLLKYRDEQKKRRERSGAGPERFEMTQ